MSVAASVAKGMRLIYGIACIFFRLLPTVRTSALRYLPILLVSFLIANCTSKSTHYKSITTASFEPRAISNLRAFSSGTVRLRLAINDLTLIPDLLVHDDETHISLDSTAFTDETNEIRVEFFLQLSDGSFNTLATSTLSVPLPAAGSAIELSGLFYEYADSDNDGLYNVHELLISPVDVDGDGADNVNDTDSDNDGVPDGEDLQPYGPSISSAASGVTLQFDLLQPNAKVEKIKIVGIEGIADELLHLANTLGEVELRTPALWPDVIEPNIGGTTQWAAYGLGNGSNTLCPQLRIGIGTTSLKSSLSDTALLYFRRHDGSPFVAAIAANEIPNFDIYENDGQLTGNGPWNDGLRIILVPDGAVGWLDLWTEQNFSGDKCELNLSTALGVVSN